MADAKRAIQHISNSVDAICKKCGKKGQDCSLACYNHTCPMYEAEDRISKQALIIGGVR